MKDVKKLCETGKQKQHHTAKTWQGDNGSDDILFTFFDSPTTLITK